MDDEPSNWRSLDLFLNLIGLAAGVVAIFAGGGLALLGGAVAVACLAGSVAVIFAPEPSPCERCLPECDRMIPPVNNDLAAGIEPEAGQSRYWQQRESVDRPPSRRR